MGPSLNDPKGEREKEHCLCPFTQAEGVEVCPQPPNSGAVPSLNCRNFSAPVS